MLTKQSQFQLKSAELEKLSSVSAFKHIFLFPLNLVSGKKVQAIYHCHNDKQQAQSELVMSPYGPATHNVRCMGFFLCQLCSR